MSFHLHGYKFIQQKDMQLKSLLKNEVPVGGWVGCRLGMEGMGAPEPRIFFVGVMALLFFIYLQGVVDRVE